MRKIALFFLFAITHFASLSAQNTPFSSPRNALSKPAANPSPRIFISYRRDDSKAEADFLASELAEVFGADAIFRDVDTLSAGLWRSQIKEGIAGSSVTLVVIGKKWLEIKDKAGKLRLQQPNDVHREEIAQALQTKPMLVIPVLVQGASMPAAARLPENIRALGEWQARNLSEDSSAHHRIDVASLVEDIKKSGVRALSEALSYVPFGLDQASAKEAFSKWANSQRMTPGDFKTAATVEKLNAVWEPYWVGDVTLRGVWRAQREKPADKPVATADTTAAPQATSAAAIPEVKQGELTLPLDAIYTKGSDKATGIPFVAASLARLKLGGLPDDAKAAEPSVSNEAAKLTLVNGAKQTAQEKVLRDLGGEGWKVTNFDMVADWRSLKMIYYPVYEGSYSYDGETYPVAINGDTGDTVSQSPYSRLKLGFLAGIAAMVVAVIAFLKLRK